MIKRYQAPLLVLGAGIASYPLAGLLADGYRTLPEHVARFLFAFVVYLVACAVVLRLPPRRSTLAVVVGVAVALRLAMVATTPSLSSDVYRYVWEGKLVNQGISPYDFAPEAPELVPYRDRLWDLVNHKHLISPYPPLTLGYYAAVYAIWPDSVQAMQIGAALLDLGVVGALAALLAVRGLPLQRVAIYAWHPLPLAAFAHSAHNDPLMVAPLVLAVALGARRRNMGEEDGRLAPAASALLLTLAGLAKFVPFLVAPVFVRRWGAVGIGVAAIVTIVGYAPFLMAGPAVLRGTLGEATDARFNDSVHLLLERLTMPLGSSAATAVQIVTLGVLVFGLVLAWRRWRRPEDLPAAVFFLLGLYVVLSPQVHPWYAAWILPFVALFLRRGEHRPFRPDPALGWLLWSGLVVLTELTYAPGFSQRWWIAIRLAEYGPLFALLIGWSLRPTWQRVSVLRRASPGG